MAVYSGRPRARADSVLGRHALWPRGLPLGRALLVTGALLVFPAGATWLVQRDHRTESEIRLAARGQALAETVAQAACAETTFADAGRLARILASAARQGGLAAGAILDETGLVVAHTDPLRAGKAWLGPVPGDAEGGAAARARAELFDGRPGTVCLRPLLDARGAAGTVALLLPEPPRAFPGRGWLRTFLPAGLMVLAFLGLIQMTTRWALRPTAAFLERLAGTLDPPQAPAGALDRPRAPAAAPTASGEFCDELRERALRRARELQAAQEELIIRNRTLDYERRRTAAVLEQLPDGLILTDALDQIVLVNRAAGALLGLAHAGSASDSPELPPRLRELLAGVGRGGRLIHEAPAEQGTRPLLITHTPLAGPQERSAGSLYLLRDVTAQRAAQQAQAEFLSQISHELKSPLNTIVAYVEALADEQQLQPGERQEFYNTLSSEAQRMARLISNLLQLSRIQLGNLSARFAYVKTDTLVRGLAESVAAQAAARRQRLDVQVPENLPALYGDKDLVGVAITNLLGNAIKYTPEGGEIALRASADGGGVTVEVADNGIGIPAEDLERVFERFARSEQEEVRRQSGTGLGLALVREIAELHAGRVTVESETGQGSRFRLWLPGREAGERLDLGAAA